MNQDLLYQIALTLVPNIGPVQAKILLQQYEPKEIFNAKRHALENIEGIGSIRANNIKDFNDFKTAEKEIAFAEKQQILPLFLTDEKYPKRLLNCYDSPILLYYRGKADLNASKIVSVIGTRKHTDYGKQFTDNFIADLAMLNVSVISGLAYGIDAIAHKASLKNNLPTIGVLAHGLDQIYPPQNAGIAWEMAKTSGGLLTEFRSGTTPDKHNFPSRNRIVAGMSDATIVIETGIKGGSMITAELANGYNKDVFAVPGKVSDHKSAGCNHLIKTNRAVLLTDAKQLIEFMGWVPSFEFRVAGYGLGVTGYGLGVPGSELGVRSSESGVGPARRSFSGGGRQRELFVELSKEEKIIVEILREKEATHIDEINLRSALSNGTVATALLNLELQNIIYAKPGKFYSLC